MNTFAGYANSSQSMHTAASQAPLDRALLLCVLCLCAIGLVMMASASLEYSALQYADPWHQVKRQAGFYAIGFLLMGLAMAVPTEFWRQYSVHFLLFGIVLLALVLIPGVGKTVNGSQRWIGLGAFNLQASEPAKVFVLFYLAAYLVRRQDLVRTDWRGFAKPMAVLGLIVALLLAEPDFGALVVLLGAALGMFFLAGVRIWQFLPLIAGSLFGLSVLALIAPYRAARLASFQDPWADQFNSGYQLVQSLIAFGRGELNGLGLGKSIQKLFYLPEAHTDFVFAIVGEELGFIGAILVLALFAFLIARILLVAYRAEQQQAVFSAYLAYGIALLLALQIFINIGVSTGLLPTKGLTLPFFSYGGSSLVMCCFMVGCVLRISFETRQACKKTL